MLFVVVGCCLLVIDADMVGSGVLVWLMLLVGFDVVGVRCCNVLFNVSVVARCCWLALLSVSS